MRLLITTFIFCFLINCTPNKTAKVIVIQPLGNFSNKEAVKVFNQIKKINSSVILKNNIPFPHNSYFEPRNRYRADSLIKHLSSTIGKDSVIIGLSKNDISTTKGKIKDWGVMGLGYRPGNACIVSSFRLSKKNKTEQFYKVALHELGHTEGLPHCKIKTCLMRDAEGGNPLDKEKDFCKDCKRYLKQKNWKLSKA